MAKNKILGWKNAFQGLKELTGIALDSFGRTSLDALKSFMEHKAILEKPKEIQAIRNLKFQKSEASMMAEKQQKSNETFYGIFINTPNRKPGSKQ